MDLHYYFKTECGKAHALNKRGQFITLYKHYRRNNTHQMATLDDRIFYAIVKACEHLHNNLVSYLTSSERCLHGVMTDTVRYRGDRAYTLVLFANGSSNYIGNNELTLVA